ncbi:CenpB-DNA-bind-domain-containing protein [Polyporus arcularius HHB13444]|uniref:CenpB-DNA-bind-domain-containing protein n=1 Tax=Polyporus arcularius HHB13444 TaxID=1314778 RepID=A0A5C3P2Q2_9APHY|nr:CenpB-DNA-bind-domain-containing protein [Polyporus arcularius HHB13444]
MDVNEIVSVDNSHRYYPRYTDLGPSSQPWSQPTPARRPTPPMTSEDPTFDENAAGTSAAPAVLPPQHAVPSDPGPHTPVSTSVGHPPVPSKSASASGKVPMEKTRLWPVDRANICRYAEANPYRKHEEVAAHFGLERSTVSKILKHKGKWHYDDLDRKARSDYPKHRPGKFPDLELRLEEWAKLATRSRNSVSDSALRNKARAFADEMGITADKFKASSGWLENFKHRAGIRRGKYVGNGTAEAAVAYVTAPALAATFAPPPVPNVPPPLEHGSYIQDIHRTYEDYSPHASPSASLSPSSSRRAWSQPDEQSALPGGSSVMTHAHIDHIPAQTVDFEYQHPGRSSSVPTPVDYSALSSTPQLTARSASEPYAESDRPVAPFPLRDDQPVTTLQEAEAALDRFIAWVRQDQEVLTIEEEKRVMDIKYALFEKAGGRI